MRRPVAMLLLAVAIFAALVPFTIVPLVLVGSVVFVAAVAGRVRRDPISPRPILRGLVVPLHLPRASLPAA